MEEPVMMNHKNKLFAAASAAVAAAAVAISGMATADAAPADAAPAAAHRISGIEHFQIVAGSATARTASVIATGVFTAGGADLPGTTADILRFPGGTFQVTHSPGHGTHSFDARTCVATVNFHGTITLGHGTGRYAGISGHGTYTLTILEIAARSHGTCSPDLMPVAFQQIVQAHGRVHL
jgi:hypothetical protein